VIGQRGQGEAKRRGANFLQFTKSTLSAQTTKRKTTGKKAIKATKAIKAKAEQQKPKRSKKKT